MEALIRVKIYYPNKWKKYIGDAATDDDKHFNWFICAKKYMDDNGETVAEFDIGSLFYHQPSGQNYVNDAPLKILILDENFVSKDFKFDNYSGVAKRGQYCPDECVICNEIDIYILTSALRQYDKNECPLLGYAKTNYHTISKMTPQLAGVKTIDDAIAKYGKDGMCKIAYDATAKK